MQSIWSTCEACIVNRVNLQRNVVPLALPSPFPPGFGASFKNLMRFDLTTQTCQNGLVHQKNFQGEYEIFLFENTETHIALKIIPSFAKWYCIFTWCYKQLKYWRRLHELDFKYSTHLTSWTIFLGGLKQLKNHWYDVYTHFLGVKNTMWVSESLWVVAIATLNIASGSCTG